MKSKHIYLLSLALLILSHGAKGQNSLIINNLNVPQSRMANPALKPSGTFHVGLPGMSGIGFNLSNNYFNFSDVIVKSWNGDSLASIFHKGYDIDSFLSRLSDKNVIEPKADIQLFSFGAAIGNSGYIFLDINERITGSMVLPYDLFSLLLKGNKQFAGNRVELSALSADMKYYREAGLGYSVDLSDRLRIGFRGKMLFGIAGLRTENREFNIEVGDNYVHTINSDVTLNIMAPVNIQTYPDHTLNNVTLDDKKISSPAFMTGSGNLGLGLDAGITWEAARWLQASASVTDLGFINWKRDVTSLNIRSNYVYKGMNIDQVISGERSFEDLGRELADSMKYAFSLYPSAAVYRENLPFGFMAGLKFMVARSLSLSITSLSRVYQEKVRETVAFSAGLSFSDWFSSSLTFTGSNYRDANLGAGMSVRAGFFQFYLLSEKIPLYWNRIKIDDNSTVILPSDWNAVDLRLGMNLVFGTRPKRYAKPQSLYISE